MFSGYLVMQVVGGWLGGKQVKPEFALSATNFMVEVCVCVCVCVYVCVCLIISVVSDFKGMFL
jgi:hypothetical protein